MGFWFQTGSANAEVDRPEVDVEIVDEDGLYEAIEDAIWQALDGEQAMPHSGVDPAYVIPEFLRLLAKAGYTVTPIPAAAVSGTDRTEQ